MTDLLPQYPLPPHLSHSSAKSLLECGERYRLSRIFRVHEPPSWAATGGKVFHVLSEVLDRRIILGVLTQDASDVIDSGKEDVPPNVIHKVAQIADQLDEVDLALPGIPRVTPDSIFDATPAELAERVPEWITEACRLLFDATVTRTLSLNETSPDDWMVYGKASKTWPNKEDRAWWAHHLPIFLVRYLAWMRDMGHSVAMLNSVEPAIEVTAGTDIGTTRVEGYIDRVFLDPGGNPLIVDLKGLDVNTPLATPGGWTTMGAVQVGDQVFGANGQPVTVIRKSEVKNIDCYRVKFDDGTSIVCDAEHLWETTAGNGRKWDTSVRGVREIRDTLYERGQRHHRVRMPDPVELPAASLSIDPYLLGVWLGDGSRAVGAYTKDDPQIALELGRRGHDVYIPPGFYKYLQRKTMTAVQWRVTGLTSALKAEGLLGNKSIPDKYMRGSVQQRLDLLRGMMDTDGTWNKKRNQASFTSTDKTLAEAVRELALTLGERAAIFPVKSFGFGKHVNAYSVVWTPRNFNPFLSDRKASRVQFAKSATGKSSRRLIVEVEEVPSVPTVCIAVDAEDHLYLAGDQMVPTHNTNAREPSSAEQLGLYSVMLETLGFPKPALGYHWMARKGLMGAAHDLTPYTLDYFKFKFDNVLRQRNDGIFLANTDSKFCPCPLRDWCYIKGGKNAALVPRPWEAAKPTIKEKQ